MVLGLVAGLLRASQRIDRIVESYVSLLLLNRGLLRVDAIISVSSVITSAAAPMRGCRLQTLARGL